MLRDQLGQPAEQTFDATEATPNPDEIIATLRLAQFQLARGLDWSATELIAEAIRELSGQPLQLH